MLLHPGKEGRRREPEATVASIVSSVRLLTSSTGSDGLFSASEFRTDHVGIAPAAVEWQSRAVVARHFRVYRRNLWTAFLPPAFEPVTMLGDKRTALRGQLLGCNVIAAVKRRLAEKRVWPVASASLPHEGGHRPSVATATAGVHLQRRMFTGAQRWVPIRHSRDASYARAARLGAVRAGELSPQV